MASETLKNLESAFAGESMAHIKYRYFAKMQHALGHAELLFPKESLNPVKVLEMAIAGESYEYTEMYPTFEKAAIAEGQTLAAKEIGAQIAESKEHAAQFAARVDKARKRFAALAKVEERHANQYRAALKNAKK
jgi:rubrerythrin